MIRTIMTSTEATCLNDIDANWKIAARRVYRANGFVDWDWCIPSDEQKLFRSLAFRDDPRSATGHISVCTGRVNGEVLLYARVYPLQYR